MQNIVLVIHVIIAISIVSFILIQQGKGAEAGASFGAGASQTLFGSTGSWNFFSKVTAFLAAAFFVTSISLAILAKQKAAVPDLALPAIEQFQVEQTEEAPSDLPVLENEFLLDAVNESSEEIPEL